MTKQTEIYDVAIVGSGLGGLQCAYILASEGYKVVVLEKNRQLGGSLQVFSRNKHIFDTGVHYIGALDEGQNLNQFFKYFGIMDAVRFKKLDENGFDRIQFKGDEKTYCFGQGYDNFEKILLNDFPEEKKAIKTFTAKIQKIATNFAVYNLESDLSLDYYNNENHSLSVSDFLERITENKILQNVLGGSSMLYAGEAKKTPLYVYALIVHSYILSAHRCVDGGSKIAIHLAKQIRQMGGKVLTKSTVVSSTFNSNDLLESLVLQDDTKIKAKQFIFNIAPKQMLNIVGENKFKKAYVNRVRSMKPGISSFSLHLTLEENSLAYQNYNLYYFKDQNAWQAIQYKKEDWPNYVLVSMPFSKHTKKHSQVLSVISYMDFEEVKPWQSSFKTDYERNDRGETYLEWKQAKEEQMINFLEREVYPDIRSKILHVESSTPLTYRDYIGNNHGAMYGNEKDCKYPVKTFLNARTRIPNLFLTGQYLNLHGILGVTISSFITCFEFLNKEYLLEKVKKA